MSKLPEMPDFLNKKPEQNPPSSETTKAEPTVLPSAGDEPPPIPVEPNPKEVKKSFVVRKETKSDSENAPEVPKKPAKPNVPLKQKMISYGTIGLILLLTGTSTYFYFQYKKFEDKYIAIDSKLLNLTKQITGLNQENNKLSEKVVNYQKELENIKTIESNSEELQEKLIKNETEKKELLDKIKAMEEYLAKKAEEDLLRQQDLIRPNKNKKTSVKKTKDIPKIKPQVKIDPPKQETELSSVEKFDHLFNYETSLSSDKQLKCKDYFREETLKRCNTNHPALDYSLSTFIRELVLEGKQVKKLVYKCTSPTGKDKLFKYGPLELFNTCK